MGRLERCHEAPRIGCPYPHRSFSAREQILEFALRCEPAAARTMTSSTVSCASDKRCEETMTIRPSEPFPVSSDGVPLEKVPQPCDPLRIESVGGFVEDEDVRLT